MSDSAAGPPTDATPSSDRGVRGLLGFLRSEWAALSRLTRGLLTAYVVYVPLVWIFGVAPGEIRYESAQVHTPPGTLARVTGVVRATDDLLVLELGTAPDAIAVLDLTRASTDGLEAAVVTTVEPAPGWVYGAARREDTLHLLTSDAAEVRHVVQLPLDGSGPPTIVPADTRALWPLADGTEMGHGLTDFLTSDAWDLHPSAWPGVVSGDRVALRRAREPPGPDGTFAAPPTSRDDDLLVLDADNAEPLGWLDTVHVDHLSADPSSSGFLLIAAGSPTLVRCGSEGCRDDVVHITSRRYPLHLDHRDAVHRIAACTVEALYLYEGHPLQEDIVYLGQAPVREGCFTLAVLDERSVLVTFEDGEVQLVQFSEDADG